MPGLVPLAIQVTFRPFRTLRQELVHPKDPVPANHRKGVVYSVPCAECMGIPNPTKTCHEKFMSSERISAPLTALILQQEKVYPTNVASEQVSIKSKIKAQQR